MADCGQKRIISILALLFFVLQPATAFAKKVLNASDSGMSCCRTKRNCCCRKEGKKKAIGVKALVNCERQCSQVASASKPLDALHSCLASARIAVLIDTGVVLQARITSSSTSYLAFLYQRPPPSLS